MTSLRDLKQAQQRPLHPEATEMMLAQLGYVFRFGDSQVVTVEFPNPVLHHTYSVKTKATEMINRSVSNPALRTAITDATVKPIIVHDFGELIAEPTTGRGEINAELQQALIIANPIAFEQEVADFFFHAAVFLSEQNRPYEFDDFVRHVRKESKVQENGYGLKDKTAENLLVFYQDVRDWMEPRIFDQTRSQKFWDAPAVTQAVDHMNYFYHNIEGPLAKPNFPGSFGKAVEKWEGIHYLVSVNEQKKQMGKYNGILMCDCAPNEQCRINGRSETVLSQLYAQTQSMQPGPLQHAFANMTHEITRAAYTTARDTFIHGPDEIIYNGKTIASGIVVDHYDQILSRKKIIPYAGLAIDHLAA